VKHQVNGAFSLFVLIMLGLDYQDRTGRDGAKKEWMLKIMVKGSAPWLAAGNGRSPAATAPYRVRRPRSRANEDEVDPIKCHTAQWKILDLRNLSTDLWVPLFYMAHSFCLNSISAILRGLRDRPVEPEMR
jgi:hypothetical protein